MGRHCVLANVAVAEPLLSDQFGLDEPRDAWVQIAHARRVVVGERVTFGVLDESLIELRLPTPLAFLVELAAKQAEQSGFDFRLGMLIAGKNGVRRIGCAAGVEVLTGDYAHQSPRQRV